MGYSMRPLATLADQARQAFTQSVTGAIASVWANTFTVFGKVFALLDFEHEMRRAYLYQQLFASTAAPPWLARHGFELGLTQDPGDVAVGTVTVPVLAGTAVPAALQFTRADGLTFTTLAGATAIGATVDLPLSADLPGVLGDTAAGAALSLVDVAGAPYGFGPTATVDPAGLTGGADPEDVEAFRARVLARKRNPPQGGSATDYVKWVGEALSTVKAVYVDSFANDERSVWVCFTVTDQPAGVPTPAQVAIVQAYVDDPVRRPVTARVFVTAPAPVAIPAALTNFAPDTPDIRGAVAAELAAFFADDVQPATPSTPFVLYLEQVSAAIARAAGVGRFTLLTPTADQVFTIGSQLPVYQDPTYS